MPAVGQLLVQRPRGSSGRTLQVHWLDSRSHVRRSFAELADLGRASGLCSDMVRSSSRGVPIRPAHTFPTRNKQTTRHQTDTNPPPVSPFSSTRPLLHPKPPSIHTSLSHPSSTINPVHSDPSPPLPVTLAEHSPPPLQERR